MTEIRAEMTASVWKVKVTEGQLVNNGDELIILESMKMEIPVTASADGKVAKLHVVEEGQVAEGQLLVTLE